MTEAATSLTPGNRDQQVGGGTKGTEHLTHLGLDRDDGTVEGIDLLEMQFQQESVVRCDASVDGIGA